MANWTLEDNLNDWVKSELMQLGLQNRIHYGVESTMSARLKNALKGGSKTELKTGTGKPDFNLEGYGQNEQQPHGIPVIIEDKLGLRKLLSEDTDGNLKLDKKSVQDYAANGAVAYAQAIISSGLYDQVIAIGIAGESDENVEIKAYYVHSVGLQPKFLPFVKGLDFLESESSFKEVLNKAKLTDIERHKILIQSRSALQKKAKSLNKLMNNHSINVDQRVVYVSGCLLAMQNISEATSDIIRKEGLTPDKLTGAKSNTERDGVKIISNIKEYFEKVNVPAERVDLLLSTFQNAISTDSDRDEPIAIDREMGDLLVGKASLNKQIFSYIYENIYKAIDATSGHLDIMGEMYSEFLKYALSDGKDIGIVLTPPYITKMMVEILDINKNSRVMDLATGSAGFLISAMAHMAQEAEMEYGKGTLKADAKIAEIKKSQLLGVELDAKMYALATTNMILRGDSVTNIQKGSSFDRPEALYEQFKADRLLLNPPFSYEGNGMPFLEFGLDHMAEGGLAAIIVQDSAGSGKAVTVNKRILKKHTLLASIKMPGDLFQPNAGVQTSIYVVKSGIPHDFEKTVKFINFKDDGYKRTGRGLQEIDHPTERYSDIVKIYKAGQQARIPEAHRELWNLSNVYVEDQITDSGKDWNFEQHQKLDLIPSEEDFVKVVGDYLAWEVTKLLTQSAEPMSNLEGKQS